MQYRRLGKTGIDVSAISFGAGPVPQLLTGGDASRQTDTVRRAIELGVNWFDTAATYGAGQSERSLGAALAILGRPVGVHVATKVRLMDDHLADIGAAVKASVAESLKRLGVERVALLQLHNSVTAGLGDQPTSLTPAHVLAPGGVLEAMHDLRREGLVEHLGLTGIGDPPALAELIDTDQFATIQIPFNLLNPSAGEDVGPDFAEVNYGNLIARCARQGMGVFAIRVLAGGAIVDQEPSAHTKTTKFFPLDLYERDRRKAAELRRIMPQGENLKRVAVRFVLSHPNVTSAIVGVSDAAQLEEVIEASEAGPLDAKLAGALGRAVAAENASALRPR